MFVRKERCGKGFFYEVNEHPPLRRDDPHPRAGKEKTTGEGGKCRIFLHHCHQGEGEFHGETPVLA